MTQRTSHQLVAALRLPDGRPVLKFRQDWYANATYTARLFNELVTNIIRYEEWEKRVTFVSRETGLPRSELIQAVPGRNGGNYSVLE